ncbi:DUF418 domain-containing protein [Pseudomonas sp. SK3(2021)]|uniref:DUF418 domain-containing protein n=1 Tax=Pseudomonas sp. SK3(2021) TaxID=2841064 RepID=UPI00192B2C50|nr:DUF418 domain-containing protein [Pseudomonas sp. SK3(2021)]QQZ43170.1 DUF418 domain-containing protein [Pseudomonas sp. SK3(2021)]
MNLPFQPVNGYPPATPAPRLQQVDALRGFALFGILTVNIWSFADPYYASSSTNPAYPGALDHLIRWLLWTFFEAKFYLLFSFLFGYSFTLQMLSAERSGKRFVPRMLRRQLALLGLGLAHGALLFYGDILSLYALLGLVLLALRDLSARWAAGLAILLLTGSAMLFLLFGIELLNAGVYSGPAQGEPVLKAMALGGSALDTLVFNASHLPETAAALWLLQAPSTLAMFLLGYVAGRKRLLVAPYRFARHTPRLLAITLPVGLGGALLYGYWTAYFPGGGLEVMGYGISQLSAPLLSASYGMLLLKAFDSSAGQRLCQWLAPLGRMSLSNYLLQSLILNLLFTGYGLGLVDRLPTLWIALLPIAIYLLQRPLSALWLRHHPYGPGEWLLRAVTIGAWPDWRTPLKA